MAVDICRTNILKDHGFISCADIFPTETGYWDRTYRRAHAFFFSQQTLFIVTVTNHGLLPAIASRFQVGIFLYPSLLEILLLFEYASI